MDTKGNCCNYWFPENGECLLLSSQSEDGYSIDTYDTSEGGRVSYTTLRTESRIPHLNMDRSTKLNRNCVSTHTTNKQYTVSSRMKSSLSEARPGCHGGDDSNTRETWLKSCGGDCSFSCEACPRSEGGDDSVSYEACLRSEGGDDSVTCEMLLQAPGGDDSVSYEACPRSEGGEDSVSHEACPRSESGDGSVSYEACPRSESGDGSVSYEAWPRSEGGDDSVSHEACPRSEGGDDSVICEMLLQAPGNDECSLGNKCRGRKRVRNPENWKKNIRKRLRNQGKSYVSVRSKQVEARKPRLVPCKCKQKCSDSISAEQRQMIFNEYWVTGSYQRQLDFIVRHVEEFACTLHLQQKVGPEHNVLRRYHLTIEGKRTKVCKNFFLDTMGISKHAVEAAMQKKLPGGTMSPDLRGKHGKQTKLSQDDIAGVKNHIESFPQMDAHYTRKQSQRQYLDSDLNLNKLYEDYVAEQKEQGKSTVAKHSYRHIFNTQFNLSFHVPKKDQCVTCVRLTDDEEGKKEHLRKKDRARKEKEADKQRDLNDKSFKSVTFDLQSVLYTPYSEVSTMYYLRKLCVYNFTIFEQGSRDDYCYFWDETNGGRGSCEIGTCLFSYLLSLSPLIVHVTLFSDTCAGQNRNQYVARALIQAAKHSNIHVIDQKFLTSGHTQMECDSMHSCIERAKKNVEIFVPDGWKNVLLLARRNKPYLVTEMEFDTFFNFKECVLENTKIDEQGKPVRWKDLVFLRIQKEDPDRILFKYDFDEEEFHSMRLTLRKLRDHRRRKEMVKEFDPFQSPLYTNPLPIDSKKHDDLLQLCQQGIIPRHYATFYKDLPSTSGVGIRLPVPDVQEDSDDSDG